MSELDTALDEASPLTEPRALPARLRINALSNYAQVVVSFVLALVMTPVLVHGLGKSGYGLWALIGSLVVYLETLNLGFGTAAVRSVSENIALGRLDKARRAVATCVHVLSVPAFVALVVGGALAFAVPHLFNVPPGQRTAATLLMLIVTVDFALSIPLDTFGGVLNMFNRFDLLNLTLIAVLLGQAAGWVIVLSLGGGLVALGLVTVGLSLTAQFVRFLIARRLLGGVSLAPRNFDRTLVRSLAGMSMWVAITEITWIVIARTDTIIVGAAISVPAAGVYAVGLKLAQLGTQVVDPVARTFFPHAAKLSARNDRAGLAELIVTGTRLVMALVLPATVVLLLLARPAVHAWVGSGFRDAALVTMFLAGAAAVGGITETGIRVLYGVGDARPMALTMIGEAILNLSLSVALALTMGLAGVALATLLAAVVMRGFVLFPYVCRRYDVSVPRLLVSVVRAHLVPAAVAVAVGLALRSHAHGIGGVVGVGAVVGAAYLALFAVTGMSRDERARLVRRTPWRSRGEGGPLRLVFYTDSAGRYGAEQALGNLVAALDPAYDVTIAGTYREVVEWLAGRRPGARAHVFPPVRDKRDLRPILAHIRGMRGLRPDLFHANLRHSWSCQYGILGAALRPRTKILVTEHALLPASSRFQHLFRRLLERRIAMHVTVGEHAATALERLIGLPAGSVRVIPNGVQEPEAAGLPAPRDPGRLKLIGAIARLSPEKGIDLLVRALPEVPDAQVVVVGDGPERPELERLARELGVASRFTLVGWSDDPGRWLRTFDVLAVPSRSESFGMVAVEAMLAGVPVVATAAGGLQEIVTDGETGLLVEPDDARALAAALRRALGDPALREALARRARTHAQGRYTPAAAARAYELLYAELAGR